eukprot:TRINITY_DN4851_c0_g1_i1.p1 TRINITY_DN4851_c0_g1~~TRINITY_DN4851_c0_g1_i1.p1  ORF type:complete len:479 (+),score=99.38 TRINITY_DN4851_c0_g1_i1:52-1437(+)
MSFVRLMIQMAVLYSTATAFVWSCDDDQVLGARDWITATVQSVENIEDCQKLCLSNTGCQVISYLPLENEGKCMMVNAQKTDLVANVGATTCVVSNSTDTDDLEAESPIYIEQPRNSTAKGTSVAAPSGVVAESVAWCTTDFECRTFGDEQAICNRRNWQCDCSSEFEHKEIGGVVQYLCRPKNNEDKNALPKVPTIIMSSFDKANKGSYLKSSDFFDSDVAEAVSEAFSGRPILSHTSIVGESSVHIAVELALEADDISLTLPTISQKIRNSLQVKTHLGSALGLSVANKVRIVSTGARTTACYVSNAQKTVLMTIGKKEQCSALECYDNSEKVRDNKDGSVLCIKKASATTGFDWRGKSVSPPGSAPAGSTSGSSSATGASTSGVQCQVDSDCHADFSCYDGACVIEEQDTGNLGFMCTALTGTAVVLLFIGVAIRTLVKKFSKSQRRPTKSYSSDCGI